MEFIVTISLNISKKFTLDNGLISIKAYLRKLQQMQRTEVGQQLQVGIASRALA